MKRRPVIEPVLRDAAMPSWDGALWIGEIDLRDTAHDVELARSTGYQRARLLVRDEILPLGYIIVPIVDGVVSSADIAAALSTAQLVQRDKLPLTRQAVTVIVCTRNRPDSLARALDSILALDYPDFRVIVVDNASSDRRTIEYVEAVSDPRVRLIVEPRPGLSRARNTGAAAADTEILAFTDDDVMVDRHWLTALIAGFEWPDRIGLVTGSVATDTIHTPAEAYFDQVADWAGTLTPRTLGMDPRPRDYPGFPLNIGAFGTGANFAVRKSRVLALGGFNEALGAGAPTGGGEDLEIFFRIVAGGERMVREPAAIVWHFHRADVDELGAQSASYGTGLGAMLFSLMLVPRYAWIIVSTLVWRFPALVRALRITPARYRPAADLASDIPAPVGRSMYASVSRGPAMYVKARFTGFAPRPLRKRRTRSAG